MNPVIEEVKPDPRSLLAPEGFENFWAGNVTDTDYHADKNSVSSSSLKKIVQVSPKTFYHSFYVAGPREPSKAMKLGKLAHSAILEGAKFKDRFVLEPIHQGFTKKGEPTTSPNASEVKEAKALWWQQLPEGSIVTTIEERDKILGMIDSLLSHARANEFLSAGIAECSGYYRDPETGIQCRIRPDFMCLKRGIITDLKTAEDPREEAFKWQVYGDRFPLWYDFSLAMYVEGFFQIQKQRCELAAWIAVGSSGAHEVAVHPMTIPVQEVGHIKYRRALTKLRESIDSGVWHGIQRPDELSFIVPPMNLLEEYGVNYDTELI